MNTLVIKDLAVTESLDSKAMATVRGGVFSFSGLDGSAFNFGITPLQFVKQAQQVFTQNSGGTASVTPVQAASNTNTFNLFPFVS